MRYYIGLDVGTTGAKALIIDEKGKLLASAVNEYPVNSPRLLWSEQNPEDWWEASQKSISGVIKKSGVKPEEIGGIGLTGQMHGLVMLDKSGRVLRPCIMWNDQRTAPECAEITELIGFEKLVRETGNQVLPGFTAPKILWVKKYEPEIYEKTAHILLPKDYIRLKLTGNYVMDVADASGTSLLNVSERKWSELMLAALEINKEWMPELMESVEVSGTVTSEASDRTLVPEGTPVIAGAGDQAAGGIGVGAVNEGITSVVLGTSGVVFSATGNLKVEPEGKVHAFCHAVPDSWHVMGVTLSAAGSYKWVRDNLFTGEKTLADDMAIDPYEIFNTEAGLVTPGSDGLLFLPYLSGERTPYPDPYAKGTFTGITTAHKKQHFVRAVLEGVTYSLRDCLELNRSLGIEPGKIRLSGGGAKSNLWRQIVADVFNAEVETLTVTDGAPYGAALLAAAGTGAYGNIEEAVRKTIEIGSVTSPIKENTKIYEDYYSVYRSLYPALKTVFGTISRTNEKHFNY